MSFELTTAEIAKNTPGGILAAAGEDLPVKIFSIDTRSIKKGDCFIAFKGADFNGHDFIPDALNKGARGVIYDEDIPDNLLHSSRNNFFIRVPDTYQAVIDLAKYKRGKINFPVLAVTGSTGKTTVKELSAGLLNARYSTYKNYLNQNNILGLSLNILNCSSEYEFAVFELGISKFTEMDVLLDILKPDHGLITNIYPVHTEYLEQEDKIFREKIKLFKNLNSSSLAFYSLDNTYAAEVEKEYSKSLNLKTFGLISKNDYWAEIKSIGLLKTELAIGGKFEISVPLLGKQNACNIIAAVAVAVELGVDLEDCKKALSDFNPLPGRMCHYSFGDIDIIDDSYNSNPAALRAALEFISSLNYEGLKIAIISDMLELGPFAQKAHFDAGVFASVLNIDYFLCYGNEVKYVVEGLLENGVSKKRIYYSDFGNMADILYQLAGEKALLLFKASRNMGIDLVLNQFKEPNHD